MLRLEDNSDKILISNLKITDKEIEKRTKKLHNKGKLLIFYSQDKKKNTEELLFFKFLANFISFPSQKTAFYSIGTR